MNPRVTQAGLFTQAIVAALLLVVSGCNRDPHVQAEKHLQSAEGWLKQNKADEAAIEVRRAIQLEPQFAKAHFELAKLQMRKGEFAGAFQSFLLAVKYDPENREAHISIADILLRSGRFADAKTKAEAISEKWPGDTAAQLVLAEAQIALGEDYNARMLLANLLKSDSSNPRIVFDLAALDFKNRDLDQAITNLRRAWALGPGNVLAPVVLSKVYEGRNDIRQAEEVLTEALQRQPDSLQARYALASLYLRHNRIAECEQVLRQVRELGSKESQHRAVLAQLYTILGRLPEAEAEYKRVLAVYPNDTLNWRRLAELYLAMGRREDAASVCDRLLKKAGDWETHDLRGRVYLADSNPDQALLHFRLARRINPDEAAISFHIAQAQLKQGDTEQAKMSLEEAVRLQPNFAAAWLLLSELAMRTGDVDRAIEDLNSQAAQRQLPQLEANLLLSRAYALKGELDLADQTLSKLMERQSEKQSAAVVLYNLGRIRLQRGRAKDAEHMASLALQDDARSQEALYLLGISQIAQKQADRALEVVRTYVEKDPSWAAGFDTLARIEFQTGKFDQAEQSFKKALELQPNSFASSLGLAESYVAEKKTDLAHNVYEQIAKQSPNTAFLQTRLGMLEENSGDWQTAKASYERAIALDSKDSIAKNNLAWIYAQHGGNLSVALRLAQEAKEINPQDPNIADTLGWILTQVGVYDMAEQNFRQSLDKNPNSPTYMYHLGLAYYKMGRFPEAKQQLQKALKISDFAFASDARNLLAQMPGT
jgi:tetratricopeptide (TPR) repeat protein